MTDEKSQEFARQMKIFGEAYMWVLWNPQKGDVRRDYQQAVAAGNTAYENFNKASKQATEMAEANSRLGPVSPLLP